MKKKCKQIRGITLMELLIVVSLSGLIFTLGIYPILTQIKLFRAARTETTIFDEANLVAIYIMKDAETAEKVEVLTGTINFTIPKTTLLGTPPYFTRSSTTVTYIWNGTQLTRNNALITNRLSAINFSLIIIPNTQQHHLRCDFTLRDTANNITTQRVFEVMLRCKSADTG